MLLQAGQALELGTLDGSRLQFGEGPRTESAWAGRRVLLLDGRPAFELSFWCGTCPFLFQRLEGANDKLSLVELERKLNEGLEVLDGTVVERFGQLLPRGRYVPLLLEVRPTLVGPSEPDDYFSREQVDTWGVDAFWGMQETPRTPYYRTYAAPVNPNEHLYEFVVPMVPPTWNSAERVLEHRDGLASSALPTAVAVSTLDVCQPAIDDRSEDYHGHWGLTHFLLDGHHKMEAASRLRVPLRLLALVSVDASLASGGDVERLREIRARPAAGRRREDSRNSLR